MRCQWCNNPATFLCSFGKTRMGPVSICTEDLPKLVAQVSDSLVQWSANFKAEYIQPKVGK